MPKTPTVQDLDQLLEQLRTLRQMHEQVRRSRGLVAKRVREAWPAEGDLVDALVDELEEEGIDYGHRIERLEYAIGQLRAQRAEAGSGRGRKGR
ncbi:MAG: hypothetical protein AAGD35_03595 [Actinomycetota bacterium]